MYNRIKGYLNINIEIRGLTMDKKLIVIIMMAILLLSWIIAIAITYKKKLKKKVSDMDFDVKVKCQTCNNKYISTADKYIKHSFTKTRSTTSSKVKGIALSKEPKSIYFAKKMPCPYCKKDVFGEIENINEIREKIKPLILSTGIKTLIIMLVGGLAIIAIAGIVIKAI